MLKRTMQVSLITLMLCSSFAIAAKNITNSTDGNVYTEDNLNIFINSKSPEFVLKLKSNATTGYSWFLREYDNNLVAPVAHSFQANTVRIGAPGYELWTFRMKPAAFTVPQQTTIRFVYSRPQGSDESKQTVFRVSTQG